MDDEFEKIAEEAIRKAEKVECSLPEFCDGLQTILNAVFERWSISKEECATEDEGAGR